MAAQAEKKISKKMHSLAALALSSAGCLNKGWILRGGFSNAIIGKIVILIIHYNFALDFRKGSNFLFTFNCYRVMNDFVFSPSVQGDLFALLTPRQQVETANVFRHLKKASQIQLSYALMDYIQDGVIPEFTHDELILSTAFVILTEYEMDEKSPSAIVPVQHERSCETRSLGDILKTMFNR